MSTTPADTPTADPAEPTASPGRLRPGQTAPNAPSIRGVSSADDAPGPSGADADDDAAHWREAARLRGEHPGWVIIWLSPARQYRAYRRMPRARRDTALTAATGSGLATQIIQAERMPASPAPPDP